MAKGVTSAAYDGPVVNEDERRKPGQRHNQDLAMAPARGGPSVHQSTHNIGDSRQAVEPLLPGRRDLVSAVIVEPLAVLSSEHRIAVEGSQEGDVVSFHDHGHGDY